VDKQGLTEELKGIIGAYLMGQGFEMAGLYLRYERAGELVLRVLADLPEGGISLDECAQLNKGIAAALDEKAMLNEGYILEVFSPGLDRPLKTKEDFLRCLNRQAKFFLLEELDGKIELEGRIDKAGEESVYIDMDGKGIEVPLNKINKAKQIV